MIGKNLLHYRILEKLGAGGMGDVYLAEDTKLKRKVALKVLPEDMALDPVRLARFRREAEAVAALNHPNIVTIYSVEDADGVHFLTMELVEGKPLQKLIPGSGIDLRQFFDIAIPLADALASAHAKGITHRDLKPPNVMISTEGRVTMLDFGLAKFVERAESAGEESATRARTQDGLVVGTVPYMSPEQLEGKEVDHRTDIFSLGILLYELATGQKPFEGDTNLSRISAILKDTPRPVTEIRTALPRELNRILQRCLEKDPNRRYALAREVRDELLELKANVISASSSDAVRARAADKSIAVLPFTNMSADSENEYFSDGLSEEIINALSQLEGLRVAARTSSFSFKGKSPDIGEVGDKLKVATVLEGSVRKAGNRLRITAQLVNVADGFHLWSERFDRTMDDIFDVQDEIATRIAEKLKVTLAGEPDQPIVRQVTQNTEAYDLYLKGRFFLAQRGEGIQKALDCFQKALELDPQFALAHAGKADAHSFLGFYNVWPPKKAFPKARTAANEALALDETLADAHVSLAMVSLFHDWDWPACARAFREALTLKPDHALAHSWFSLYYSSLGRFDEAYAEARRGPELDPLSLEVSMGLFSADYLARHHEEGIRHARATLEIHPNIGEVFRLMGMHHLELSQFDDAIRCFEKALSIWPDDAWAALNLATAFARCGRTGEAFHADYTQFLDPAGLDGSRLGVARNFPGFDDRVIALFDKAVEDMKAAGAVVVDPANLPHVDTGTVFEELPMTVLNYEFKDGINRYFESLGPDAPVKSLTELIAFNIENSDREMSYFGQELLITSEESGSLEDEEYLTAVRTIQRYTREEGIDALMDEHNLDAIIAPTRGPGWLTDHILGDSLSGGSSAGPAAIAGYPDITIPMGNVSGLPVGVSFFGRRWSEPTLLRIAYAYEQATNHRTEPEFLETLG